MIVPGPEKATILHVGILIVMNIGVVWGRANGAVWGSRKVRRKGRIRAMRDVRLDPRFGRGVAFRYGQRRGGDGEGSNLNRPARDPALKPSHVFRGEGSNT